MGTVRRFEDLEVWKMARMQCEEIFKLIQSGDYRDDPDLRSQMNRSSASVMDNISEGFERFTRADFRNFLVIAKGLNGELRSQLYRILDRSLIAQEHFARTIQANELLGRKLFAFIHFLTNTDIKDKSSANVRTSTGTSEPEVDYFNTLQHLHDLPEGFFTRSHI